MAAYDGGMRVLLVEDEPKMARLLQRGLVENGHIVEWARTGEAAVDAATTGEFDAVLLDVMLPDVDGFEVCRRLRHNRNWAPVLMLTARTAIRDRIHGLDVGADDYLTKPFALVELLARLRALARRGPVERPTVLSVGDLTLNPATRQVCRAGEGVLVSAREFTLLEAFMRRPGRVLTRDQLLELAWDASEDGHSNVVDVYVRYLREKIDRPFGRRSLQTVRGVGYRLDSSGR
jgi:two-component system, OmpR family, response regulator